MLKNNEPDQKHIQKIQNQQYQPVFIMGMHRSGTTILYKMLQDTKTFNQVTAYHLIKYDQLITNHLNKTEQKEKERLTKYFQAQGLQDRGIDKHKPTANFAEEYCFHLDRYSTKSNLTKRNHKIFDLFLKKIQFIEKNNKPILLKNPYDFPNFTYIKKTIPNAKFIFIHRHPLKVLSSLIKAVRHLFITKNLYATQISRIYNRLYENPLSRIVIKFLTLEKNPLGVILLNINATIAVRKHIKNIDNLSKEDYISITYETLCEKPQETMESIIKFLKIKPEKKIDFTTYIHPRKTKLDPAVDRQKILLYKSMKPYFKKYSYSLENH